MGHAILFTTHINMTLGGHTTLASLLRPFLLGCAVELEIHLPIGLGTGRGNLEMNTEKVMAGLTAGPPLHSGPVWVGPDWRIWIDVLLVGRCGLFCLILCLNRLPSPPPFLRIRPLFPRSRLL